MSRAKGILASGLMVAVGLVLAGCTNPDQWVTDTRVPPPHLANGQSATAMAVNKDNAEEVQAVEAHQQATQNYRQSLKVLNAYYTRVGHYDNQKFSENELKNLDNAQTFQFAGLPAPATPAAQSVEGVDEVALVEQVVRDRRAWQDSLDRLADVYTRASADYKLKLVRNVQARFDPMWVYDYVLAAEIPPATLKPVEVVPEAEALYSRAYKTYKDGKPFPLLTSYRKEREALMLFRELIRKYPSSTKIALSAYYVGEIYKEYFNEDVRAVNWYERAWQWDPNIIQPARFQAATVYDIRMGHYAKALQLYKEVLKYEQFNRSNVDYATHRIEQLEKPK